MTVKRKLGKGLDSIISSSPTLAAAADLAPVSRETVGDTEIEVASIVPNPDQPRENFNEADIRGLAQSIKSQGLINPIVVRKYNDGYAIVAGERRFRAVKQLGYKNVKVRIIEADEQKNFTLALIENIQREDLNPVEEAKAYKMLVDKFGLKQQEVAERVGRERASIANSMRLLNLSDDILAALASGRISTGHAKVLLGAPASMQKKLCESVIAEGLSVRALEEAVRSAKPAADSAVKPKQGSKQKLKEAHIASMEEKLRNSLGTKVEIRHSGKKGKIEISYFSLDDFERIMDIIAKG